MFTQEHSGFEFCVYSLYQSLYGIVFFLRLAGLDFRPRHGIEASFLIGGIPSWAESQPHLQDSAQLGNSLVDYGYFPLQTNFLPQQISVSAVL